MLMESIYYGFETYSLRHLVASVFNLACIASSMYEFFAIIFTLIAVDGKEFVYFGSERVKNVL